MNSFATIREIQRLMDECREPALPPQRNEQRIARLLGLDAGEVGERRTSNTELGKDVNDESDAEEGTR